MKKHARKILSLFLVLIIGSITMVSAFAYDTNTEDIIYFGSSINGDTGELEFFNFDLDSSYVYMDENEFAFEVWDDYGNVIADETMGYFEYYTPFDNEGYGFELYFYFTESVVVDTEASYSLYVPAGIFSDETGFYNDYLVIDFDAAEFVYIPYEPTWVDHFYNFLVSNVVTRVLFAPIIALIEYFYYGPVY